MEKESHYNPNTRWGEKLGPEQEGTIEEMVFYTVLRQTTASAEQISFHLKNGCQHTLAVGEIMEMYYDPANGIILFFSLGSIHIKGRNLEKLHRHLKDRKVKEIREFSEKADLLFSPDALVISTIEYHSENLRRIGI